MVLFSSTAGLAALVTASLAVPVAPAPGSVGAEPGTRAGAVIRAAVPCPKTPAPKWSMPERPSPPTDDPVHRAVGGEELATTGLAVPPGASRPPAVSATSWIVADLDTGAVLGACGPHEYGAPASVQKLLLAATMLPKLDPHEVITVTPEDMDFEPGSSAVGLVEGGKYSVEMLWLGLLLVSGNDAANVLARLGGGSGGAAAGVREMNAEAQRLGAYQTHAVTPSGLDGPGQYTSAYDLALIARACFADPAFQRYTITRQAKVPAQRRHVKGFEIGNQNRLLDEYPGALGGKTGYTDLARHTYVGAAARNGRRLVVTLLGAEYLPLSGWQQGAALLDWGFSQPADAAVGHLVDPAGAASPAPVVAAAQQASTAGSGGGTGTPRILALGAVVAAAGLAISATARRRRRRT
ncbi:putative penicillin-binding protein DacB1 [Catellatospora sp. TT07R-123]|uniref:D-alanyl-D-alanine carboxypeptidase family protein n=1 Tax=Catellatospora sp. TT07R-123 TaxID=2733863 RepID=UPI001B138DB3|nr:serine hydrolase [Catellatospora sp. TT07R-123]GHJ49354.1 putative penicillin-binding protein DacB1 [Catellatospora sp. TT07R-123]